MDKDGDIDVVVANLNDNEKPDFIIDSDEDGGLDMVILDVEVDENGELAMDENGVPIVSGVVSDVQINLTDEHHLLDEMAEEETGTVDSALETVQNGDAILDPEPVYGVEPIEGDILADPISDMDVAMDTSLEGGEM